MAMIKPSVLCRTVEVASRLFFRSYSSGLVALKVHCPPRLNHGASLSTSVHCCSKSVKKKPGSDGNVKKVKPIKKKPDPDSDDEEDHPNSSDLDRHISEIRQIEDTPAALFIRNFAKSASSKVKKDKLKSKGGHFTVLSYAEVMAILDINEFWSQMDKLCQNQLDHYKQHLTIRSVMALDELPVHLDGAEYALRELADVSKKDAHTIVFDCSAFPQATSKIVKVLRDSSGFNWNPEQDGSRIYVPVPKVTQEHRQRLATGARDRFNETKEAIKKLTHKYTSKVDNLAMSKDAHCPKHHFLSLNEILHHIAEHFTAQAESMMHKKQKDLLDVS